MWKPYIPFYMPCRQAMHEEQRALQDYLIRDLKAKVDNAVNTDSEDETSDGDPIMMHETASHEIFSLVLDSILVVFDWQYYQTSSLVPKHERTQQFAKVMCVFWHGKPDSAELFTWSHDGVFRRLASDYTPEEKLAKWEPPSTESIL